MQAKALERVRRGTRLIDAAAENRRPAIAHVAGDAVQHGFIFNGTWPGNADGVAPADRHFRHFAAANKNDRIVFMELAAGELIWLHDRDNFFHAFNVTQTMFYFLITAKCDVRLHFFIII